MSESKVAIVTVHGTGDTATGPDGEKWFQRGSQFSQRLQQNLSAQGLKAEIVPHLWSGANSAWDRERGANKLAARLRGLYNKYDSIHVIGHSHGGNVANDAAVLLKWGLRRTAEREKFDSLTTVGTPFFNVKTGTPQRVAGVLFVIIAWASAIVFPLIASYLIFGLVTGESTMDMTRTEEFYATLIYILLVGPCTLFMLHMSRQGIRRILRPRTGGRTRTSVFSIWHDNDEAIAFLQRVEELKLEPFPRGSFFRGSRAFAVSLGVLIVLAIGLANPVLYAFGMADLLDFNTTGADDDVTSNIIAVTVMSLLVAPAIFTSVYLGYRFLVGGAQEIGVRGSMNRFVGGVMRGVAMGRDGDQILCNVAPRSHTYTTQDYVITGECASRMQEKANGAAGALIDKYRWALFTVGGDSSASLTSLTTDAMTWDSLIHTTYFDQPEVAAAIANHIARTVRESAHAGKPAPQAGPVAGGAPATA
ncbi:MAG: esterase/lipase family protein [Hyphomonadaceae bacterium]